MRRAVQRKLKSNPFFRFHGLIIGLLIAISLQTGHPVAAATNTPTGTAAVATAAEAHFVPLLPDTDMKTNEVELQGIPFHVISTDRGYQSLLPGTVSAHNRTFSRLFFLGLATDGPEGSEWWGMSERWYSQRYRIGGPPRATGIGGSQHRTGLCVDWPAQGDLGWRRAMNDGALTHNTINKQKLTQQNKYEKNNKQNSRNL